MKFWFLDNSFALLIHVQVMRSMQVKLISNMMACHKQQLTSMNGLGMRLVKMPMANFDCRKIIKWHISLMFTTLNVHINYRIKVVTKAQIRHWIALYVKIIKNSKIHLPITPIYFQMKTVSFFIKWWKIYLPKNITHKIYVCGPLMNHKTTNSR